MRRRQTRSATSVLLGVGLLASGVVVQPMAALADVTFEVDNIDDVSDANPGDGICDIGDGTCTLRGAVEEANAFAGNDTIVLPGYSFALTSELVVSPSSGTDTLTIRGVGMGGTVIDGDNPLSWSDTTGWDIADGDKAALHRVLNVTSGAGLVLEDLTIEGGGIHGTSGTAVGGGVHVLFGSFTATRVEFIGNAALTTPGTGGSGGALALGTNSGAALVTDSRFLGNTSDGPGGAIYATGASLNVQRTHFEGNGNPIGTADHNVHPEDFTPTVGGAITVATQNPATIQDSTFMVNAARSEGGAVFFVSAGAADSVVLDSTFAGNETAQYGGAISSIVFFDIFNSRFEGNRALGHIAGTPVTGVGGALQLFAGGDVGRVLVRGNESYLAGGIGSRALGTGLINVFESSIVENTAVNGGGLGSDGSQLQVLATSVIGNSATTDGGGIWIANNASADMTGEHVTIAFNDAPDNAQAGTVGLRDIDLVDSIIDWEPDAPNQCSNINVLTGNVVRDGITNCTVTAGAGVNDLTGGQILNRNNGTLANRVGNGHWGSLIDQVHPSANIAVVCGGVDGRGVDQRASSCTPGSLERAHFVVNTHLDVNGFMGDGVCDDGGGLCSVREAISEAGTVLGRASVELSSPTAAASSFGDAYNLAGQIDVTGVAVTVTPNLTGAADPFTIVQSSATDRLFSVTAPATLDLTSISLGREAPVSNIAAGGLVVLSGAGASLRVENALLANGLALLGGGVAASAGTLVELVDLSMHDNLATDNGGAVYATGADVRLRGVSFQDNQASDTGGGLYAQNATINILGGGFTSNGAGTALAPDAPDTTISRGGALGATTSSTLTVRGTLFTGNDAGGAPGVGGQGGAIWVQDSSTSIEPSAFTDAGLTYGSRPSFSANDGGFTGAIAAADPDPFDGTFSVVGASFDNNTGSTAGALSLGVGNPLTAVVARNSFTNHTTHDSPGTGGAVQAFTNGGGGLTLADNTFSANHAETSAAPTLADGGAVYVLETPIDGWWSNHFEGNTAEGEGGAVFLDPVADQQPLLHNDFVVDGISLSSGGGFHIEGEAWIRDSFFRNNAATQGGAIDQVTFDPLRVTDSQFILNDATTGSGGAIRTEGLLSEIHGSRFADNEAASNGGAIDLMIGSSATITDTDFVDNIASNAGGAIETQSASLFVSDGDFTGNQATGDGGAIEFTDGSLVLTDVLLSGNSAVAGVGGALDVAIAPTFSMNRVRVEGNSSGSAGGGIHTNQATLTATNLALSGNTSNNVGGGGLYAANSTGLIDESSIFDNDALGAIVDGGGVYVIAASDIDLRNTTIAGNTAVTNGGGLFVDSAIVDLDQVTVTDNSAGNIGGGVAINSGTATTFSTILAGNSALNGGNDCDGGFTSSPYTLIQDSTGCTFTPEPNQIIGQDPLLDVRSGTTWNTAHDLLAGSPAIDAVPLVAGCFTIDQRATSRPIGPDCDMGAIESANSAPEPPVVDVTLDVDQALVPPGASIVATESIPPTTLQATGSNAPEPAEVLAGPISAVPISAVPISAVPISAVPISAVNATIPGVAQVLEATPANELSLYEPIGSWATFAELIAASSFANVPLQNVSFADLLADPSVGPTLAAAPISAVDFGATPISAVPISAVPISAVAFDEMPWREILTGLSGGTPAEDVGALCQLFADNGFACSDLGLQAPNYAGADNVTILDAAVAGAPISAVPISAVPISAVPISAVSIVGIPISAVFLEASPISAVPISAVPISAVPISAVTVDGTTYTNTTLAAIPISAVPISAVDPEASPISAVPISAVPIEGTPISAVPISAVAQAGAFNIQGTPISAVPISAVPISAVSQVDSSPISAVPISAVPISAVPISAVPISAVSNPQAGVSAVPISAVDVNASPISAVPISAVDPALRAQVVDCNNVDCSNTSTVTLGEAADDGFLLAGAKLGMLDGAFAGTNHTLWDILAFVDPSQTPALQQMTLGHLTEFGGAGLGDVLPLTTMTLGDLFSLTLGTEFEDEFDDLLSDTVFGDLTNLANITIGDVLHILQTTLFADLLLAIQQGSHAEITTLLDVILALIPPELYPWEEFDVAGGGIQSAAGNNATFVTYTANIQATGVGGGPVDVELTLPAGMHVPKGTKASVLSDGITTAVPLTIVGHSVKFSVPNATDGFLVATVQATTPLSLGAKLSSIEVTHTNAGLSATDTADFTVVEEFEPNDTPADVAGADPLADGQLTLSHIGKIGDVDLTPVPLNRGDALSVFLGNVPEGADFDLVVYGPPGTELPGVGANSVNGDTQLAEDLVLLDDRPAVGFSTGRGTSSERVDLPPVSFAGTYLLSVTGYNNSTSSQPYTLQSKTFPAPTLPPCQAWPTALVNTTATPPTVSLPSVAPDTLSLFVVNRDRYAGAHGAAALAELDQLLVDISALDGTNGTPVVNGAVIDVSDLPAWAAYDTTAGRCDVGNAIAVSQQITDEVNDARTAAPGLQYVTIIGDDAQAPMMRVPDFVEIANERTYASSLARTVNGQKVADELFAAAAFGYYLTDNNFGDSIPEIISNRPVYVPEVAVGRVLESHADIAGALNRFIGANGQLDPVTEQFVAGYDFLADGSHEVADELDANAYGQTTQRLIDDYNPVAPWTSAQLLNDLPNGTADTEILSINAHYDHKQLLSSAEDDANTQADLLQATSVSGDYEGSIVFTMGCHAGLNISDVAIGGVTDWVEHWAGDQEALYVGNTGYGYGDTDLVALSERLMAQFADRLDSTMTVGQAMAFAKAEYAADLTAYGVYDEKVVMEATFYGLPMLRIGDPVAAPPAPQPVALTVDHGLPAQTGVMFSADLPNTPTGNGTEFQAVSGEKGTYFAVSQDGELFDPTVTDGQPVQPRWELDVTAHDGFGALSGDARGAVIEEIPATVTLSDINPMVATPVVDNAAERGEFKDGDLLFPTVFTNVRRIPTATGTPMDQLTFTPGQFRGTSTVGNQLLLTDVEFTVYYGDVGETDLNPPVIASSNAAANGTAVGFSVRARDREGPIQRVHVLYREPGTSDWKGADLGFVGPDAANEHWSGGAVLSAPLPENVPLSYLVQVVDEAGNVAISTAKAEFHAALGTAPPVDPGGAGYPEVNGGAQTNGWYTNDVLVSVVGDDDEDAVLIVNGVEYETTQGVPNEVTLTETGVHSIIVRDEGVETPTSVLIDKDAPTIEFTTPAPSGSIRPIYALDEVVPTNIEVNDKGSGLAEVTGIPEFLATSSRGTKSIDVTATDNVGLQNQASQSYDVVQLEAPIGPVKVGNTFTLTIKGTTQVDGLEIDWDDGNGFTPVDPANVMVETSLNRLKVDNSWASPGLYSLQVRRGGGSVVTWQFVAVYDPTVGHVTGSVKFWSPAGALYSDTSIVGEAKVAVSAKYEEGESIPTGNTNFRFKDGDLHFKSTSYDVLIINGDRAQWFGEGRLNKTDGYKFTVVGIDNDVFGVSLPDKFRIRIWRVLPDGTEQVIYDNGLGAALDSNAGTYVNKGDLKIKPG